MKKLEIEVAGQKYTAQLTKDQHGAKVFVFVSGEKMPICGTRFGTSASLTNDIEPWIRAKCERHANGILETL
jgi:hypothetical protein